MNKSFLISELPIPDICVLALTQAPDENSLGDNPVCATYAFGDISVISSNFNSASIFHASLSLILSTLFNSYGIILSLLIGIGTAFFYPAKWQLFQTLFLYVL